MTLGNQTKEEPKHDQLARNMYVEQADIKEVKPATGKQVEEEKRTANEVASHFSYHDTLLTYSGFRNFD